MNEKIEKMLKEGKISEEEAEKLIAAMNKEMPETESRTEKKVRKNKTLRQLMAGILIVTLGYLAIKTPILFNIRKALTFNPAMKVVLQGRQNFRSLCKSGKYLKMVYLYNGKQGRYFNAWYFKNTGYFCNKKCFKSYVIKKQQESA